VAPAYSQFIGKVRLSGNWRGLYSQSTGAGKSVGKEKGVQVNWVQADLLNWNPENKI
jgi:hypothetical protein